MSGVFSGRQFATSSQFDLMISFMEQLVAITATDPDVLDSTAPALGLNRHGDLSIYNGPDRLQNIQNWSKLTELLNSVTFGYPKPVNKWRKCWSDLKNNTKKKLKGIKKGTVKVGLTNLEKRLLLVLNNNESMERKASESDDNDPIRIKKETELEPCDRISPPSSNSPCRSPKPKVKNTRCRKSSASSSTSRGSGSNSIPLKRRNQSESGVSDITEKYIEFEREKEKMLHEREMARIRQNDQLFTIFGRIVSVLETLAPTIQRYLDRNSNIIEE